MGQSKMSELHIKSTNQFKFNKNNDFWITCLVIDLDDGLRFSEFKEKYGEWLWYAMPTFSNIEDDWTKFRVIIPLKYEIHLGDGENNLKVLKCLRKMFCRWEDPNHQMYFQANLEDYQKTRINNGEMYEISQDMVDDLHLYIDNCVEFKKDHLDVKKVEEELSKVSIKIKWSRDWTLDKAKEYYKKNDKDGERHTAIFVIKNNILPEYEEETKNWIYSIGKGSHWENNSIINNY